MAWIPKLKFTLQTMQPADNRQRQLHRAFITCEKVSFFYSLSHAAKTKLLLEVEMVVGELEQDIAQWLAHT